MKWIEGEPHVSFLSCLVQFLQDWCPKKNKLTSCHVWISTKTVHEQFCDPGPLPFTVKKRGNRQRDWERKRNGNGIKGESNQTEWDNFSLHSSVGLISDSISKTWGGGEKGKKKPMVSDYSVTLANSLSLFLWLFIVKEKAVRVKREVISHEVKERMISLWLGFVWTRWSPSAWYTLVSGLVYPHLILFTFFVVKG